MKEDILNHIKHSYSFGCMAKELVLKFNIPYGKLFSFTEQLCREGKIYFKRLKSNNETIFYSYEV